MAYDSAENRTNVRLLGFALRAAERLAPNWLETQAFRAFAKPDRRPGRWGALEERAHQFTLDAAGHDVVAWEWNAPSGSRTRETVLLVHGWSGNGSQLKAFVEPLTEKGYHVVAVDLPSHGASPGSFATIPSLGDAVLSISRKLRPTAIIAHSFGGVVTVRALSLGAPVERVVLLAPPVEMEPYLRHFAGRFGLSENMVQRLIARIERDVLSKTNEVMRDMDLRRIAPRLPHVRAFVVHDTTDTVTPSTSSHQLSAAWPGATWLETTGHGHEGVRKVASVVNEAVAFVTSPPAPRPDSNERASA